MHDNTLAALWFARDRDCPGKTWWNAQAMHPAIFRALRLDKDDPGAIYAVHPFRLAQIEGRHVILAAFPAPQLFTPDADWLGIETVLAWDPVANTVVALNDPEPQLVGKFDTEAHLFATPFAFFRNWLEHRAAFAIAYQAARSAHFSAPPPEGDTPGMLIVGAPDKVRWPSYRLPEIIHVAGIDPAVINRAILKASRLPRAINSMKVAA